MRHCSCQFNEGRVLFPAERLRVAWCGAMAHFAAADAEAMVFSAKSQAVESIDALHVLSTLSTSLRTGQLIPKNVYVCPTGQTDLAVAGLHRSFDHYVPTSDFAMKMHARPRYTAYLLFDLSTLLRDNHMHSVFQHTLDGKCLVDMFRRASALDKLQDLSLVALCVVLVWLQKLKDTEHAYILLMCSQGKHRSQFMARLIFLGLDLIRRIRDFDYNLRYDWIAEERIMVAQFDRSRKQQKQHPDCCLDVVRGWHRHFQSCQFISVVMSDALHEESCAINNRGAPEFSLQVCLEKLNVQTLGSFRHLVGQSERDLIKVSSLVNRFNTLKSWLFLVRQGVGALWPHKCSICSLKERLPWTWRENVPTFFRIVILDAQRACAAVAQGGQLPAEKRIAWADMGDSSEEEEQSESKKKGSARTQSQSSTGASLRTAGDSASSHGERLADASLRTVRDSAASQQPRPKRSALKGTQPRTSALNVRFVEQRDAESDVEFLCETKEYWQMKINLEAKVVLSFELASLSDEEARCDVVVKMKCGSGHPYVITSVTKVRTSLFDAAQHLMSYDDRFCAEVCFLKEKVAMSGIPIAFNESMSALHVVQVLILLHLLSILLTDDPFEFGLTYYFVDAVGRCCLEMAKVDIFELMARYVYFLWVAPRVDNECWNGGLFGLFIASKTAQSVKWWTLMQSAIKSCSESAFCEEYCCITEVTKDKFNTEMQEIEERCKRSPVRAPPSLPDHMYWIQHDCAVDVDSALTVPRVLQPLRTSASSVHGKWGNNNGSQIEVTRDNCVSECHCCLLVSDAMIPYDVTLATLLTDVALQLEDAFPACALPIPWWLPVSARGAMARPAVQKPLPESSTEHHLHAIQYRVLGLLLLSTLKPDNVMHPHLRCHFEYHVGKLLAMEIHRENLNNVLVSDFMRGCGVVFGTGDGWLEEKVRKRANAGVPLHGLLVHSMWGEKCRVQRYLDSANEDDTIFLIATSCPNQDRNPNQERNVVDCKKHFEMCGYGSLRNGFHGFSERYCRQLMFHALHYTECQGVAGRGRRDPGDTGRGLGFVYELAGEMGLHCERNEQYHSNPLRRLRIFEMPRWLPRFYSQKVQEDMPGSHFDHMPPCGRKCFLRDDIDLCRTVEETQRKRFITFEKMTMTLARQSSSNGIAFVRD